MAKEFASRSRFGLLTQLKLITTLVILLFNANAVAKRSWIAFVTPEDGDHRQIYSVSYDRNGETRCMLYPPMIDDGFTFTWQEGQNPSSSQPLAIMNLNASPFSKCGWSQSYQDIIIQDSHNRVVKARWYKQVDKAPYLWVREDLGDLISSTKWREFDEDHTDIYPAIVVQLRH
ncbi:MULTISPECIES: hypothetical protein [unclassified Endozoicomonas]|uniref:hypothetical protein n=1 Tax=unclassified Endozoicomonas TaxID=2644528 RepID=UPI003BB69326